MDKKNKGVGDQVDASSGHLRRQLDGGLLGIPSTWRRLKVQPSSGRPHIHRRLKCLAGVGVRRFEQPALLRSRAGTCVSVSVGRRPFADTGCKVLCGRFPEFRHFVVRQFDTYLWIVIGSEAESTRWQWPVGKWCSRVTVNRRRPFATPGPRLFSTTFLGEIACRKEQRTFHVPGNTLDVSPS